MLDKNFPPYLAAIDHKRNRIFILAVPHLSAVKIDDKWEYCSPLSDEEITHYELVKNLDVAFDLVKEAKTALNL